MLVAPLGILVASGASMEVLEQDRGHDQNVENVRLWSRRQRNSLLSIVYIREQKNIALPTTRSSSS